MFAHLGSAISDAAQTIGGKEKGAQTRKLTQLSTDKLISSLIIYVPLSLLVITGLFSPSTFTSGSLLCQPAQFYKTKPIQPETCDEYDPGTCRPDTDLSNLGFHRQYANSFCWNNLIHVPYTETWEVENDTVVHTFKRCESEQDCGKKKDLSVHKMFPYLLLLLTACSAVPLSFSRGADIVTLIFSNLRGKPSHKSPFSSVVDASSR